MITIPIQIDITSGTAPYTFTFKSSNSLATFSNVSGQAVLQSGVYVAKTNVLYADKSYINSGVISVEVVDANGCVQVLSPLTINNPCTLQGSITNNGEFVFVASISGGSGQYSFDWSYNTSVFSLADTNPTDNILTLAVTGYTPTSTPIQCLITDAVYGCTLSLSYSYIFCRPLVGNVVINLNCDTTTLTGCSLSPKSQFRNYNLIEAVRPCAGQTIDWTRTEFSLPVNTCIVNHNNGRISVATTRSDETFTASYRVAGTNGVSSQFAIITITAPACNTHTTLSGVPTTLQLTADDSVSDVKKTSVGNRVSDSPTWSSFQFLNTPAFGTVSINPNKEIEYTITDITTTPSIPDVISWSVQDDNGNQINITDTVLRNVLPVPTTTTDTICAACNTQTAPFDVLANDTGDIDRSTLTITLNDPDIVIEKDSNNNLIFTALPGASFANLNAYKVANTQGAFSAPQNFIVQVACAGSNKTPTKDITCDISKIFNIYDQFTSVNAFNLSFAESGIGTPYTTAGGTITGGFGTLDFSAIPFGTYEFQMTAENVVACHPAFSDTGTLTVIHAATPHITIGTPTTVSTGIYTIPFTYSGIISPFVVTDDGVQANFHTGIVANSGSGTFTLFATAGSVIVVSATTQCGVITSDSVTL